MDRRWLYIKDRAGPNPPGKTKAAALQYDPEKDSAPRLVASGQGLVAERILALARENQVPVYADTLLTDTLLHMELEQEIPPELFTVVAEVLVYIYRLKNELHQKG